MGSSSRAVAGAKDNDLRNCGCQILDDDLRAKWMRRKLLACSEQWQLRSDVRPESFYSAVSGFQWVSIGSIIHRVWRWVCSCCEQIEGFTRRGFPSLGWNGC